MRKQSQDKTVSKLALILPRQKEQDSILMFISLFNNGEGERQKNKTHKTDMEINLNGLGAQFEKITEQQPFKGKYSQVSIIINWGRGWKETM